MGTCTKCRAELSGPAKFCASCGAPIVAAPVASASVKAAESGPSLAVADEAVNPFAATASPSSSVSIEARAHLSAALAGEAAKAEDAAQREPPLSRPPPADASPISPLATSSALSQRGAFQQVIESAKDKALLSRPSPAGSPAAKKKPGTQLMQQAPPRLPGSEPSPVAKKVAARTVAMGFRPAPQPPGGGAPPSVAAPSQAPPASVVRPSQPAPAYPAYPQGDAAQAAWTGRSAPSSVGGAGAPFSYGARAFAPGARVLVTWSNGQRYPATVTQATGTQCLVVFPDGQQRWVEMQYLSPG
jgi:hypothetical protein